MISAATVTSCRLRSLPPVIFITTPVAPSIEENSNRGEEMAVKAASRARDLPVPVPIPIIAEPASAITDRTSAKSTFTKPGMVIMSVMPCTPWRNTSSASWKASCTGVCSVMTDRSLSLGITMRASTRDRRASIPSSA